MASDPTPSPGSPAAAKLGCTCAVIDNHHGQGRPTRDGPVFVFDATCPVHAKPKEECRE